MDRHPCRLEGAAGVPTVRSFRLIPPQLGRYWRASDSVFPVCTSTPTPKLALARVGIGGATGQRIETRQSVIDLFQAVGAALIAAGADVVLVDFRWCPTTNATAPGRHQSRPAAWSPREYLHREILDLSAWSWDDFLRANGDPAIPNLAVVDGERIWVNPRGTAGPRPGVRRRHQQLPGVHPAKPIESFLDIPHIEEGLRGLEQTRKTDFSSWMHRRGLDAVIFPTVADVGPARHGRQPGLG